MFAAVPTNADWVIGDESTNPTGIGIFNGYFVKLGVSQKYQF